MKKHFSSSAEVFSWLSRFINLESGVIPRIPKTYRLDRMEILAELAGHPERCTPSIHIAGSKGKGSVVGMIASMLEATGHRAARYMSPHISDFRERICLGNSFFDEAVYCAAADELYDIAEHQVPVLKNSLFDPSSEEGEALTFFELLTLYFFLCAKVGGCDCMVVETGMGGRLDSTNIIDPLVSVITLIELEHTAILGDTIPAVAGEKAGIIKPGKPVVLARQSAEALNVFKKRAAEKNSPLFYFPEIAAIENVQIHSSGTDFIMTLNSESPLPKAVLPPPHRPLSLLKQTCFSCNSGRHWGSQRVDSSQKTQLDAVLSPVAPLPFYIPIPGTVQAENAGLAVIALKTAFPDIGYDPICRGLEAVKIPARFEKIIDTPPVIIDGAHTPESASLCVDTFCSLYGVNGILLFGCAADKNAVAMADILLPRFSQIIITTPGIFRVSDPEKVYKAFASGKTLYIKETREAIMQALETGRKKNLPVLCTGSFYLASEVRIYINETKLSRC